ALARQQPFAENPLRLLERLALHERALPRHEHVLDQVRMVEEILVARPPPEAGHVAVLRGHAGERPDRVSIEGDDGRSRDALTRAGWSTDHIHPPKATPASVAEAAA